jgi:hypothetical protein
MKTVLKIVLIGAAMVLFTKKEAAADHWGRVDRPWSRVEVDHAIAYCRILPRVNNSTRFFISLVQGQEINRCMQMLGWVGVAH